MNENHDNPPVLVNGQVAQELQSLVDAQKTFVCVMAGTMTQLFNAAVLAARQCAAEGVQQVREEILTLREKGHEEMLTARLVAQENGRVDRSLVRLEADCRILDHLARRKKALEEALEDKRPGPARTSLERQLEVLTRQEAEVAARCDGTAIPALAAPEVIEETPKKKRK